MSNLPVAVSRRGAEIQRLRSHLELLDREERASRYLNSEYAKQRLQQIAVERELTEAEIVSLESLTDDELVMRFNPPPLPEDEKSVRPQDLLARGAMGPRQVVVSRSVPQGYRIGGNPAPVDPIGMARLQQEAAERA